jgi:hypothetical protein
VCARCSGGSRSGRRARRRRGSGDGSAGNKGVRSFGCASSWDFPPRQLRSTRHRTTRRRRAIGDGLPREVGAFAPLAQSRGGGRGDSAWGGRGSACRQVAYKRGDARRGGAGAHRWDNRGCGGGHAGGGNNVRRGPEEEETGILHPELGDRCPTHRIFEASEDLTFLLSRWHGGAHRGPPRACQGAEVGRGHPH